MKKIFLLILLAIAATSGWNFYHQNLNLKPVFLPLNPASTTQPKASNSTSLPLTVPPGFSMEIYADNLDNPRDLEWDPQGRLLVSITAQGQIVSLPDRQVVTSGLRRPHGLAYASGRLYIAEEDKVAVDGKKIIDLPSGGNHFTRSILVKNDQLYISIGSSCNVCNEKDPRRAAIYVSNLDGSNFRPYATGLRNSVFMALDSQKNIWATDMGRDLLGNETPPDEVNVVREGDYGWPTCYGANIHDTQFDKNQYLRDPCSDTIPSIIDLPAHSAPLGLAFIPNSWPQVYRGKLLVAFHGSWNRNPPTGYKIVLIDPQTKAVTDFISGWLQEDFTALGRPVDLTFDSTGNLFISDDKRGVIYKVTPPAPEP